MKTYIIKSYGSPDVFETIETQPPTATPGHVVVRVKASSINPLDTKIRSGIANLFSPPLPAVLHGDMSGVIEEVGAGVTDFKKGDEVYGCIGGVQNMPGALADYVLVDPQLIAHKPRTLSLEDTAALPLVSITAWEALIDRSKIQPGDKVLIHGGTGGVGHIGIQLAKLQGAQVYTTVSSDKKALLAHELGADVAINYHNESVEAYVQKYTDGKGFDVIFDTIGGKTLDASIQAVAINGQVATIAARESYDLRPLYLKNASLHAVLMLVPLLHDIGRAHHGEILKRISDLVDLGRIKPLIDPERFHFSEASRAHQKLESGGHVGKIVLFNDNESVSID